MRSGIREVEAELRVVYPVLLVEPDSIKPGFGQQQMAVNPSSELGFKLICLSWIRSSYTSV